MDDDSVKADMLSRIKTMEQIEEETQQVIGLTYTQHGKKHCSAHFDLTPLKDALQYFIKGFDGCRAAHNWAAMDAAWLDVGKAQRDVPAHVAQQYCRPDRGFDAKLEFNEAILPRVLAFYNTTTARLSESWFPLAGPAGLGFDFALVRGGWNLPAGKAGWRPPHASWRDQCVADLAAVSHLDKVRTDDLKQSVENLSQPPTAQSSQSHGI